MLDTAPDNSLRIERLSPKAASVIETFATEVVEAFKDYRSSALGQESLGKCFNSDPKRDWINNRRVRAKKKLARLLLAKDRTTPPEHLRELAVGDIALNYLSSVSYTHLTLPTR